MDKWKGLDRKGGYWKGLELQKIVCAGKVVWEKVIKQLPIPVLTRTNDKGYLITSNDNFFNEGDGLLALFDPSKSYYHSQYTPKVNTNPKITIKLPAADTAKSCTIITKWSSAGNWYLRGSNDGSNWDLLGSVPDAVTATLTINVLNPKPYLYYMLEAQHHHAVIDQINLNP